MDFDATGQLLIMNSAFVKYLRKKGGGGINEAVLLLFIDFKKEYDSVGMGSCIIFPLNLVSI